MLVRSTSPPRTGSAAFLVAFAVASTAVPANSPAGDPTYSRDVAPILHRRCAPCHRPGGVGPFPLLTFDDAASHAKQIVSVTEKRVMPPWLPVPGHGEFAGERRLDDEEISTLARWVQVGAPEGDPKDLPPAPKFAEGWQLGEPDLVVSMPAPFEIAAEGRDQLRNFVLPAPVSTPRWVRAIEILPHTQSVVHHAVVQVDDTGACRQLDLRDEEPGFAGMSMGPSRPPGGHFVGWTPGKQSEAFVAGTAYRLVPGTDVVLQLHVVPTGKPEPALASVAFHFTDAAPSRPLYTLVLRADEIDIPAGDPAHVIERSFTLPVDAEAAAIYPHAHYLARRMQIFATRPDGERTWLLRIDDWDFDWQDSYRYRAPVRLAPGSTIAMRYEYDNSAANPRNPNRPPVRVQFGEQSSDEMAAFTLELLLASDDDRRTLEEAYERRNVELHPQDFVARYNLGIVLAEQGRIDEAIAQYREAARLEPRHVHARVNLANLLKVRKLHAEAMKLYEEALALAPRDPLVLHDYGTALLETGELEQGIARLKEALALQPELVEAHLNVALALEQGRMFDEALSEFEAVSRIDPARFAAIDGITRAFARKGKLEEAEKSARRGIEVAPGEADAFRRLANVLWQRGFFEDASAAWTAVVEREPADGAARRELARTFERTGQHDLAAASYESALQLAPGDFLALTGLARVLASHPDPAKRRPAVAVELAEKAAAVAGADPFQSAEVLSTAYAAAGRLADAVKQVERALELIAGQTSPRAAALRAQLEQRLKTLRDAIARAGGR